MTAPAGVEMTRTWTPKRGKARHELVDLTIKNIYRADRRVLVEREDGQRHQLTWAELRRSWRPV